ADEMEKNLPFSGFHEAPQLLNILPNLEPGVDLLVDAFPDLVITLQGDMQEVAYPSCLNHYMRGVPADYLALNIIVHIIKGANVRKKAKAEAKAQAKER